MSWPDGDPRFIVTTVSGIKITSSSTDAGKGGGNRNANPYEAQVLDRAYAHRVVRVFDSQNYRARTGARSALDHAQRACDELNERDRQEDAA